MNLKSYKDYDLDPFSMFQQKDRDLGLAEPPLPSSPHDAIRLSLINGHSLFRGASGDVADALRVLSKSEIGAINVQIPAAGEYPDDHPAWERVRAHEGHAMLDTHDELVPSDDDTEQSEPAAMSASTKSARQNDVIDTFRVEVVVGGAWVHMQIPAKTDPAGALCMVCKKMEVGEDARLGYRLPGDPKRGPAHVLASSEDMGDAMTKLLGQLKRAHSRRADMVMRVEVLDKPKTVVPLQSKRVSQFIAKKKEIKEAIGNTPEDNQSNFATLWGKYECQVSKHDRCYVNSKVHPPVHIPMYVQDVSFWANEMGCGCATLDTPPNDMRWDSDRKLPHASSASAGSSPTTRSPYVGKNDSGENSHLGLITIESTPTRSPTPGPSCSKPLLKREASASPGPFMSDRRASKRPATGTIRPHLVIREGIKYPAAVEVLVQLNKAFPLHSYLGYEDSLAAHQIYYAPDILAHRPEWPRDEPAHSARTLPSSSASPVQVKPVKKQYKRWTTEETQMLVDGCNEWGVGNWKATLNDPRFVFQSRSPVDLKDRFCTYFPNAYRLHYPNAKTHLSSRVRLTLPDGTSIFEKARSKKRRPFSKEEDEALRRGYEQ
ncbi:hypothetical protein FRC10_002699, partial [Ceratobasidium sp. 414]